MNINETLKKKILLGGQCNNIAAKEPVADHRRTTCLMKFLWMVYYTAKDVGMLCASYVNNISYLSVTLQI